MNEGRQAILGVFVALFSVAIILGSVLLSLAEVGYEVASAPELTATQEMLSMPTLVFVLPGSTLLAMSATPQVSPTPSASPTPPANCPPPAGWVLVVAREGDTFHTLGKTYGIDREVLKAANCMLGDTLKAGSTLYVPPVTPTATVPACGGAPSWWVYYSVVSGDNIYNLAQRTSSSVSQLAWANCLVYPYTIYPGQALRLPSYPAPLPTATKKPSATLPPSPTPTTWVTLPFVTPTPTSTTVIPTTATPTATATSTATSSGQPTVTTTVTLPVIADTPTPTLTLLAPPPSVTSTATSVPPLISTPTNTQSPLPPPTSTATSATYPLAAPAGPTSSAQGTFASLLSAAAIFFVVGYSATRRDS